jgi:heat shock protein HtpX
MINIYEQADRNRNKSALVMALFVIFVVGAGWLISYLMDWGVEGVIMALVLAIVSTLFSYYAGDKMALGLAGASLVERSQAPQIYSAVENLARAAQIPAPKVYLSPDRSLNAFATGRDPKNASLCLTSGLVENLDQTELEGVVGHEISHIKNLDTRLFAVVSVLIGAIAILSRFALQSSPRQRDDQDNRGGSILFILGIAAAILSPLIGQLIQLAISRRREFLADADSAKLTRQPEGLIQALKKLGQNQRPSAYANNATAHFYIVNPFSAQGAIKGLANLFNTHPPLEKRIAELEKMI